MALDSLAGLYVQELKDLYSAERQILKALPKMIKAATHQELKSAFTDHLKQSKGHVDRLVRICDDLGVSPKGKKCNGMEGIIKEGAELIAEGPDAAVLDAGLASAAQHVEHYEMAGYGSVRTWAEQLGFDSHVALLQQTLDEERKADQLLSRIATSELNFDAELDIARGDGLADVVSGKASSATKGKKPGARSQVEMR